MADDKIRLQRDSDNCWRPVSDWDRELSLTVPLGASVAIKPPKRMRNLGKHKRFFALLGEGFLYWEFNWRSVSESEVWLAKQALKTMAGAGVPIEDAKAAMINALNRLKHKRSTVIDTEAIKTKEAYLEHVMIKSGYGVLKPDPKGGLSWGRQSIAFDNMTQETFDQVYKAVYGVIWNETLQAVYHDQEALDMRINQLMGFG